MSMPYCDCPRTEKEKSQAAKGKQKIFRMRPTKAFKDQCQYCGTYVVWNYGYTPSSGDDFYEQPYSLNLPQEES